MLSDSHLVTDLMGTAYMALAPCTDTARIAPLPKARQPRTIQILETNQLQVTRIRQAIMREFPASKRYRGKPWHGFPSSGLTVVLLVGR